MARRAPAHPKSSEVHGRQGKLQNFCEHGVRDGLLLTACDERAAEPSSTT